MKGVSRGNKGLFWFIILLGAISGTIVGEILGSSIKSMSFLGKFYSVGTSKPLVLDLKFMTLTLGINFNINIMTILFIIAAIIIYRKY
ncbi:DUF4321 domain-containing protein [Clostridium sp. JN-9]|uniref:DUF4321 domain-containing protein n=1 Tax=Clostridium sp. JN-9 TaxID=2507159 RepID=UPI000FFE0AD3|nr:DUF4321 domain-containing protein [Clostridium sp. JN-9]QAT39579.1 DUF4321 domain-containing protein [Clostridium sp. JN-9]